MPDDERSMRDIMEEVYDRMTADDPEEGTPPGLAFTGGEDSDEARAQAERYKTMSDIWDKYNGPEAKEWERAEAPDTWSREAREKFTDLSPDAKKMVLTEWRAAHSSAYRNGRWAQYLQSHGVSDDHAMDQLLTLEHTLRRGTPEQKRRLAAYMLTSYDIPARQAVAQALSGRERNAATSALESFGDTVDSKGQKLRPHFKALKRDMQRLMDASPGLSIQNAYAQAAAKRGLGGPVNGNDKTVRETLEETYDRIMARERGRARH